MENYDEIIDNLKVIFKEQGVEVAERTMVEHFNAIDAQVPEEVAKVFKELKAPASLDVV